MTAAVVELNPLPYSVRPRTENHNLASVCRLGLVFLFISRIKVGRERLELRAARVNAFVDGLEAQTLPVVSHLPFGSPRQVREASVRERGLLEIAQRRGRNLFERVPLDSTLYLHHLSNLFEEPGVYARQTVDFLKRPAVAQRIRDVREAL